MFRKIAIVLTVIVSLASPLALPAISFAADNPDIKQNLCVGTDLTITGGCSKLDDSAVQKRLDKLIKTFIDLFSSFVGITAVVMVMVGGFKYITSGGSDSNVSAAKNTIIYAIIGIIVVAFAQYLVKYVLSQVASAGFK